MAGFDRKRIAATTQEALASQQQEHNKARPERGNTNLDYHTIDEGDNKHRIYPFHPDGGGKSFTESKTVSFLPIEQAKRDDKGKEIEGEFEVKNKPVFNSKVHGGLEKDLVEEYMQFAKDTAIPDRFSDEGKAKQAWNKVIGYKDAKGNFVSGIKPQDGWVMYSDKWSNKTQQWEFGQLEVKKSIKGKMLDAAADLNSPDPYTDPDEGIALILNKNSAAGAKDPNKYYDVKLDTELVTDEKTKRKMTEYIPTPLSDEQLDHWYKQPSLFKKYRNSFTQKDFLLQLEGLERFDKLNGLGVFDYDEFLGIVEEIQAQVAPDPEVEKKEPPVEKAVAPPAKVSSPKQTASRTAAPARTAAATTRRTATPPPPIEESGDEGFEPSDDLPFDTNENDQNAEERKPVPTAAAGGSIKDRMNKLKANTAKK